MIWVIFLLLALVIFCTSNTILKDFLYDHDAIAFIGGILLGTFIVVLSITIPVCYISSMETLAEMEAFYNEVQDNYEYTIDETRNLTITLPTIQNTGESIIDLNALIYWGLAGNVSSRIAELRDKVTEYNESYRKFDVFNNNFFTDCLYAELPDYLGPINLKTKE